MTVVTVESKRKLIETATIHTVWGALLELASNKTEMRGTRTQSFTITHMSDRSLQFNLESGATRMCSRANVNKFVVLTRTEQFDQISGSVQAPSYLRVACTVAGLTTD